MPEARTLDAGRAGATPSRSEALFPCLWVTPFAFYGEKTATLLQALDRCLPSGKLDEVECCLLHALEPGRSLVFDWLVDLGFAPSEDGPVAGVAKLETCLRKG